MEQVLNTYQDNYYIYEVVWRVVISVVALHYLSANIQEWPAILVIGAPWLMFMWVFRPLLVLLEGKLLEFTTKNYQLLVLNFLLWGQVILGAL